MIESIKKLFGLGPSINYKQLVTDGAVILDVRTPDEYGQGHILGAINIPVEKLRENLYQLVSKQMTIIACCTDGGKSWYAKNLLDASGYKKVVDAGSWTRLQRSLEYH